MSEQIKKPVGITETILRDAHQSLIATRMPTELMLPIVETMDKQDIIQQNAGVVQHLMLPLDSYMKIHGTDSVN